MRNLLCRVKSTWLTVKRLKSYSLSYSEYGEPLKVLKMVEEEWYKSLGPKEVRIRMLAASINPADINTIQGTYGIKADLPAVAGNEGVGEVVEVGQEVKNLKAGSWVIPLAQGSVSTWRTHYHGSEDKFIQVPNNLSIEAACTLLVNPSTGFRLLEDFVALGKGESVIQNGANSGVGQSVIQLAKLRGIKTINVVRKRENLEELRHYLTDLGADYVITEEDLRTPLMVEIMQATGRPRLGLNCVGGKSTTDMMRHLGNGGTLVTYGGMSRQPLTIPTTSLIFKDIAFKGFWLTRWMKENASSKERLEMMDYLCQGLLSGKLKAPKCKLVPFQEYDLAIRDAMQPYINRKHILVMDSQYLKS